MEGLIYGNTHAVKSTLMKYKETKDKIMHITINLRKLRHELKLCEHIAERSKVMGQGLETVLNDEQKTRAKNKSRGYER